jgi:hypothetical protein
MKVRGGWAAGWASDAPGRVEIACLVPSFPTECIFLGLDQITAATLTNLRSHTLVEVIPGHLRPDERSDSTEQLRP